MNVRKMLARLNPSTVRFDLGRGGVAEITGDDIRRALANVEPRIAREVFCVKWWPDGAAMVADKILTAVYLEAMREWTRRMRPVVRARMRIRDAKRDGLPVGPHERAVTWAKQDQWKVKDPVVDLRTICGAALREYSGPALCRHCSGRGEVEVQALVKECADCSGTGVAAWSERERARQCMRSPDGFESWRPAYLWVLDALNEWDRIAGEQIENALSLEAA